MPPTAVSSRRDLEEYLGQSLLSEYLERVDGRTRQIATSLKSYLVEAHIRDGQLPAGIVESFRSVEATRDRTLYRAYDDRDVAYFIDVQDERFPFLHTIGHTNQTDSVVNRITKSDGVDRCWLPSQLLLSSQLGRMIGFRFFHQRLVGGLSDSLEAEELAKELGRRQAPPFRMAVSEYVNAEEDLTILRELLPLGRRSAVESLSWRSKARDNTEEFIHNQVWATGKVAAYGTSWATHLNNMLTVRDVYKNVLSTIEDSHALRWEAGGLDGRVLEIQFLAPTLVEDVARLAADLCGARDPFRLAGTWQEVKPGHLLIHAVDMHVGDRVTIELTRDFLRVLLPASACANVVLRLLVNVERHLSSELSTSFDSLLQPAS